MEIHPRGKPVKKPIFLIVAAALALAAYVSILHRREPR